MNIKKHKETIIDFLGNLIPIILIAMIVRRYIKSIGLEDFTANTLFIVIILLGTYIYVVFMGAYEKLSPKIAQLFNKRLERQTIETNECLLNDRKENLSKSKEIEDEKLKIAIEYTKEKFSKYVSDNDLEKLCTYIEFYYEQENLDEVKAIEVKILKTIDIYHFAWNIYYHFNKSINQKELVLFFKRIFPGILENKEENYLVRNLKRAPEKGIIKIQHDLLDDKSQTID